MNLQQDRNITLKLKLKDIAKVFFGATFRYRIEPCEYGNIRVIQMKDIGEDNLVHLDNAVRVDHPIINPSQIAHFCDIIFCSRGRKNTAAIFKEENESLIVAAPLLRIYPDLRKVVPEYLLWWINQSSSQNYFASRSRGTMVKMVSKEDLEDLEVILPSLEQQRKIVELFNLSNEIQDLLEEIKKLKALYTQGILMQMVFESCPNGGNEDTV